MVFTEKTACSLKVNWQFCPQHGPEVSPTEEKIAIGVLPLRPRGKTEDQGQDGGQEGLGVERAADGGDRQGRL